MDRTRIVCAHKREVINDSDRGHSAFVSRKSFDDCVSGCGLLDLSSRLIFQKFSLLTVSHKAIRFEEPKRTVELGLTSTTLEWRFADAAMYAIDTCIFYGSSQDLKIM